MSGDNMLEIKDRDGAYVPDWIKDECRKWMDDNTAKVDGGLLISDEFGFYFFPVYLNWPFDIELEDRLVDLEQKLYSENGVHVECWMAPPKKYGSVESFAEFAIKE